MRRYLLSILLLVSPALARADTGTPRPLSPDATRSVGLERMWFTQLSLDRGRGRVAGIFMHVSGIQAHTVFQITHDGKRYVFSQRDRNAFGKEIGVEGAKKQADDKAQEIKKAQEDAGKADAEAPAIETFVVPKITLYATSERGGVHALDGETGRTIWTTSVGNPLYPTTPPAANDKFVGVCNGSTIYAIRADDGSVVWTRPAVGSPGAGPALTEEYMFVPMVSGQVETLLLEDPNRPMGIYKSFGRTMVQPVVSSNSVAWPTEDGNLYVGLAHTPGLRFRMKAADAIESAPAFLSPDKICATSADGYIYCLGEQKGNIIWRFTTGEPINHSPIALGNTVFAISERGAMYAIDVETVAERWVATGIRSYLAGNEKRLYCLDTRGNLAILDTATGSRLGGIPSVPCDVPVLNAQTDRILLVSSTGLVQCLRETNLPWPVVHYKIEPPQKTAKTQPKTGPKTDDKSLPPADTDPFGSPSGKSTSPPPAAGPDPFAEAAPAKP